MRLKTLTLKGFKSFPDRTRLDFGPGVSVVVGPNGSGKSNVTDAVLWAMGEQSPLAVRGQSMQDVIFGGGAGVQARSAAEVEIVLDNSDGTVDLPLSEISIMRRLDRSGEGEYRLNGARCRLVDVIEVLSDTGLGKETHSVISQGRVESIVTSKARERRLLIEEAAGLGKYRKRRRRAQLKLQRTQENLDRALDVEREARTRLRPLKRQAEAAELHERLERQMLELRFELAGEALRARSVELDAAEAQVQSTRAARQEVESRLQAVLDRRGAAERALAERTERHDALARQAYDARSVHERLQLRCEQAQATCAGLTQRLERTALELQNRNEAPPAGEHGDRSGPDQQAAGQERIRALEKQLDDIQREQEQETGSEVEGLQQTLKAAAARASELQDELESASEAREHADAQADAERERLREAERSAEAARRDAARVGAELAATNQFLRSHVQAAGSGARSKKTLSEALQVKAGYELALAAALGGRLDASLVKDMATAEDLLDGCGPDGGLALLAGEAAAESPRSTERQQHEDSARNSTRVDSQAPVAGALFLLDLLHGPRAVIELAERLLADAWVVESLEALPADFNGIAATPTGRVLFASWGEVRQVTEGGSERMLVRRNERERLIAASETAVQTEHAAASAVEHCSEQVRAADVLREQAEHEVRETQRRAAEVAEEQRRTEWLIQQRQVTPQQGPLAVQRAHLEGELTAERLKAERVAREHAQRIEDVQRLEAQHAADALLVPLGERLIGSLCSLAEVVSERVVGLNELLAGDRVAGEQMALQLRECAEEEAEIQTRLRAQGEAVTNAELVAQRLRDQASDAEEELRTVAERLQVDLSQTEKDTQSPKAALTEEQIQVLTTRLERLVRRREQLGPVNPLALDQYTEALAHVDELESHRNDLETALRELRTVIRDTDRQIHETFQSTFEAAARNFEELAEHVFPGGRGRLTLVREELTPHPVLGGQRVPDSDKNADEQSQAMEQAADAEAEMSEHSEDEQELMGVEIEVTPAGKSTKRLSLLSGGEKSMTALAFLFAVFLARPCPFYILDEVEAALDDLNLDRFLALLRRYAGRAQFIVITHQKRTMEAADWLYGVSMGGDGASKVISRSLPPEETLATDMAEVA